MGRGRDRRHRRQMVQARSRGRTADARGLADALSADRASPSRSPAARGALHAAAAERSLYFNSVMIARSLPSMSVSVCTRSRGLKNVSPGDRLFVTLLPSGVVDFKVPLSR